MLSRKLEVDHQSDMGYELIRLSVFPVSLSGATSEWFAKECIGTVTTWEDLVEKFVQKLKGNLFDFETPLCKAFNEFNYLLKIDMDLFTFDIQDLKTYDEYEHELNNDMAWGLDEQWNYEANNAGNIQDDQGLEKNPTHEPSACNVRRFEMIKYSFEADEEYVVVKELELKGNLFDFETPLCKAFNEFNYLLKIDTDLFTFDIQDLKTYDEYEYELNNDMAWGLDEQWSDNEEETLIHKAILEESWGDATLGVMKFCAWLKNSFKDFHKLEYDILVKLEERWWKVYTHECSPFTRNYEANNADNIQDDQGLEKNHTHEPSACNVRRFEMIKYSFEADEEYVAVKELNKEDTAYQRLDFTRKRVCSRPNTPYPAEYIRRDHGRVRWGHGWVVGQVAHLAAEVAHVAVESGCLTLVE
ncbi:hypothetical protein Tco_0103589 [Tanacetum coccineum]